MKIDIIQYVLKDNEIVYIDDVESGLKCNCFCCACGGRLIARKGSKRMHHFAHESSVGCEYGYETSLHLMAKKILSEMPYFQLPEYEAVFYTGSKNDSVHRHIIQPAKEIKIDKVEIEKQFDSFKPDLVIYSGTKQYFVEIWVTHKVDDKKREKLIRQGISTIEIDLSKYREAEIDEEQLKTIFLTDSSLKKWVYYKFTDDCNLLDIVYWEQFDLREKLKRYLEQTKVLPIPPVIMEYGTYFTQLKQLTNSAKYPIDCVSYSYFNNKEDPILKVMIKKKIIYVDIFMYRATLVKHQKELEKQKISGIEIDYSNIQNIEDIRFDAADLIKRTRWIFNNYENKRLNKIKRNANRFTIINDYDYGVELVNCCPLKKIATVQYDCKRCANYFGIDQKQNCVICHKVNVIPINIFPKGCPKGDNKRLCTSCIYYSGIDKEMKNILCEFGCW